MPAVCPKISKLCSVFDDAVSTAFPKMYGKLKFVAALTPRATKPIAILGDSGRQKDMSRLNTSLREVLLVVSSEPSAPETRIFETTGGTSVGTTEYFVIVVAFSNYSTCCEICFTENWIPAISNKVMCLCLLSWKKVESSLQEAPAPHSSFVMTSQLTAWHTTMWQSVYGAPQSCQLGSISVLQYDSSRWTIILTSHHQFAAALSMMQLLLLMLSDDLQIHLHSYWLDVLSLVTLDIAVSSRTVLDEAPSIFKIYMSWQYGSQCFLTDVADTSRDLRYESTDEGRGLASTRMWSFTAVYDLLHLGLDGNSRVTDECIQKALTGCDLGCQDLREKKNVKSASVSASSYGCVQLLSINLENCYQVTDAGVSALGHRCGQLQSINLAVCNTVTDAGI